MNQMKTILDSDKLLAGSLCLGSTSGNFSPTKATQLGWFAARGVSVGELLWVSRN